MAKLPELTTGTWLDDASLGPDVAHELQLLTGLITKGVFDAVLALRMYEEASEDRGIDRVLDKSNRNRDRTRVREEELAAADTGELDSGGDVQRMDRIRQRAERDVVQEMWEEGELPSELEHRLPFLHAQTFVGSLAQVRRALGVMARIVPDLAELAAACSDFDEALPSLKGVRDSVEHAEDRIRRRNKKGQGITLAPVTTSAIHAPAGGVLIGGNLTGNHFGWTVEDGTFQEIEISDRSVEVARVAVQRALDGLPWRSFGYPTYLPRQ